MDDASDAAPLLASLRERAAELEAAVRLVRLRFKSCRSKFSGWERSRANRFAPRLNSMVERGKSIRALNLFFFSFPLSRSLSLSQNPSQDEAARLEAWNAEKPELQAYIAALAESRSLLRKQLQGLEATRKARAAEAAEARVRAKAAAAAATASPPPPTAAASSPSSASASASNPPSPTPGFNVITAHRAPGVPAPSDAALVAERDRLLGGVARLEEALAEARARADGGGGAATATATYPSNPFAAAPPSSAASDPASASAPASAPAPDPSRSQEARARAEADVWASQLVALQDTLRLTRL